MDKKNNLSYTPWERILLPTISKRLLSEKYGSDLETTQALLNVANEHFQTHKERGNVIGSLINTTTRYAAWSSAVHATTKEELLQNKDFILDELTQLFKQNLQLHLDSYIQNFDEEFDSSQTEFSTTFSIRKLEEVLNMQVPKGVETFYKELLKLQPAVIQLNIGHLCNHWLVNEPFYILLNDSFESNTITKESKKNFPGNQLGVYQEAQYLRNVVNEPVWPIAQSRSGDNSCTLFCKANGELFIYCFTHNDKTFLAPLNITFDALIDAQFTLKNTDNGVEHYQVVTKPTHRPRFHDIIPTKNYYESDSEIISDANSYQEVLVNFFQNISDGDIIFENFSASVNNENNLYTLSFTLNNHPSTIDIAILHDWLDIRITDKINVLLKKYNIGEKRFCPITMANFGQEIAVFYANKTQYDQLIKYNYLMS